MEGKSSQAVLEPPVGWLPPARGNDQELRTRRHSRAGEQAGTKEISSRWGVRPPRPTSPRCAELPVYVQGHAGTSHQKILQKKRKDGAAVLPSACHSYVLPGIHGTGRARKGMHTSTGNRPPSLPSSAPGTQKGPLAGALVSFSLVRPEPDTVIGTTRRFQPWRELPSWLRAGGSVR